MITCGSCHLVVRTPLEALAHPCDDEAVREFGTHHVEPERTADGRILSEALEDWRLRHPHGVDMPPQPAGAKRARRT